MILRPLNIDRDAEALHEIFGNEESCRFLLDPPTASVAETHALLVGYDSKDDPSLNWVIAETEDELALGRAKMIPRYGDVFEAVIMLRPDATGRGLATRALASACDIVFDQRDARRIFADIDPDNTASIGVFERLGFKREGVLRENWVTHLGARDSLYLSLLRSDPRTWQR